MTSEYNVFKENKVSCPERWAYQLESLWHQHPHSEIMASKMVTPNGSELTSPPRSHQRQDSTGQGKMLTLPHSSYNESIFSSVLIFSIAFEACYLCVCVYVCMLCVCMCMHTKSLQSCLTLCDPMDCSPPGCSVHEILQTRILKWGAMPSSRGYSWLRDQTHISVSCLGKPLVPPEKSMWFIFSIIFFNSLTLFHTAIY